MTWLTRRPPGPADRPCPQITSESHSAARSARAASHRWAHRHGDQRGTSAIELVILAPLLIVILLFVVGLGRIAHARQEMNAVAEDSARAASLERNTAQSAAAARTAAQQSLGQAGVSCTDLQVHVDLGSYQPGGQVSVTVECTAELDDVALAGFPGHKTFEATSVVPIETYRSN